VLECQKEKTTEQSCSTVLPSGPRGGLQLVAGPFCSHPGPEPDSFHHHISPSGNSCSGLPEPPWLCPFLGFRGGPFTQGGAIMLQMVALAHWRLTR